MKHKSLLSIMLIPLLFSCGGNGGGNTPTVVDPLSEEEWKTAFNKFNYDENRNFKVSMKMNTIAESAGTKQIFKITDDMSIDGYAKECYMTQDGGSSKYETKLYSKKINDFVWCINKQSEKYCVCENTNIYGDSQDMYINSFAELAELKSAFSYDTENKCYFCAGLFPYGPVIMVSYSQFYFDETTKLLKKIVTQAGEDMSLQTAYVYMEYNFSDYDNVTVNLPFKDEDVDFGNYLREVKEDSSKKIISDEFTISSYPSIAFICDFTDVMKTLTKISVKKVEDKTVVDATISNVYIYLNGTLLEKDKDYYINNNASILLNNIAVTPSTKLNFKIEYDMSTVKYYSPVYLEIE